MLPTHTRDPSILSEQGQTLKIFGANNSGSARPVPSVGFGGVVLVRTGKDSWSEEPVARR